MVDFLSWPVVVFLHAVFGVFCPAKTQKTAMYQRIARLSLLGSVVIFMTIPLSLIVTPVIGIRLPLVLGVVLRSYSSSSATCATIRPKMKMPNTTFPEGEVENEDN